MESKNILFLVGGIIIGSIAGILSTKKYYKKIYEERSDEEIECMRKVFEHGSIDVQNESEDDFPDYEEYMRPGELEKNKLIRESLKQEEKDMVNYQNMYHGEGETRDFGLLPQIQEDYSTDPAELEYPTDEEDEINQEMRDWHGKHNGQKPRIISIEEAGDLPPGVDNKILFYYVYDDTLTDEDDQEIENPEDIIGDALIKYGFSDNDSEKMIFVINYDLDTCYEVSKVFASFGDYGNGI